MSKFECKVACLILKHCFVIRITNMSAHQLKLHMLPESTVTDGKSEICRLCMTGSVTTVSEVLFFKIKKVLVLTQLGVSVENLQDDVKQTS